VPVLTDFLVAHARLRTMWTCPYVQDMCMEGDPRMGDHDEEMEMGA
jgi:hypothetical protein